MYEIVTVNIIFILEIIVTPKWNVASKQIRNQDLDGIIVCINMIVSHSNHLQPAYLCILFNNRWLLSSKMRIMAFIHLPGTRSKHDQLDWSGW